MNETWNLPKIIDELGDDAVVVAMGGHAQALRRMFATMSREQLSSTALDVAHSDGVHMTVAECGQSVIAALG